MPAAKLIAVLLTFFNLFVLVFNGLLVARFIVSWILPHPDAHGWSRLIFDLTEPILMPLRRFLPGGQGIDWAPLAAFLILRILQAGVYYLILHYL